MKKLKIYKMEEWGISVWWDGIQVAAAVKCWPEEISGLRTLSVRTLKIGEVFTMDDFVAAEV